MRSATHPRPQALPGHRHHPFDGGDNGPWVLDGDVVSAIDQAPEAPAGELIPDLVRPLKGDVLSLHEAKAPSEVHAWPSDHLRHDEAIIRAFDFRPIEETHKPELRLRGQTVHGGIPIAGGGSALPIEQHRQLPGLPGYNRDLRVQLAIVEGLKAMGLRHQPTEQGAAHRFKPIPQMPRPVGITPWVRLTEVGVEQLSTAGEEAIHVVRDALRLSVAQL